jgi:SAM-dependent methyltransferase
MDHLSSLKGRGEAGRVEPMKLPLEKFVLDEGSGVRLHPEHQAFPYSDGQAVEERLLRVLTQAADLSTMSRELVRKITDWPSEYHLSPQRHNLLRHLDRLDGARVLELGAGCGAVTRFLGERGAHVSAVEGSLIRARCARERCRDLDNVEVYCSDFRGIQFKANYDLATLIGVLEYSPTFFHSRQPFLDCLTMVRKTLAPQGRLVIAIENQLGLKYFCGSPEDHLSRQFVGLEDLYPPGSVRTVGRAELAGLLRQAGFTSVTLQYPFPDYKLPRFVFTEEAFTCPGFAPWEIIRQQSARDYTGRHAALMDERLVWPVVGRNGLIPDLANSFLVVASCTALPPSTDAGPALLAVGYTVDRAAPYNVATSFWGEDGQVSIKKEPLTRPDPAEGAGDRINAVLVHRPGQETYVAGSHLESELRKAIRSGSLDGYVEGLQAWLHFLYRHGVVELDARDASRSLIKQDFIDCLPRNLILSEKGLTFIDREWEYHGRCSVAVLALRYFHACSGDPAFLEFLRRHFPQRRDAFAALSGSVGVQIDDATVQEFVGVNNEILRKVFPWAPPLTATRVDTWLRRHPSLRSRTYAERALRKGFWLLRSFARWAGRFLPTLG